MAGWLCPLPQAVDRVVTAQHTAECWLRSQHKLDRPGCQRSPRLSSGESLTCRAQGSALPDISAAPQELQRQLIDAKTGLPKIRRPLEYAQLLKDIRLGSVSKLHFVDVAKTYHRDLLTNPEMWRPLSGDALVVYKDGHVGYTCVPPSDVRIPLACETCGVELSRLPPALEPPRGRFQLPELTGASATGVIIGIPLLLLGAAYVATQVGAHLRGDREDRIRIRQQAERMRKRAEAQQAADELALMPRRMAGEGASEAEICAALERQRVPYQLDYVRRLVDEETAKREGRVPAQLLSQRLSSSQEASTSGQGPDAAAALEADSAQFNTDEPAQRAAFEAAKKAEEESTGDAATDSNMELLKMRSARIIRAPKGKQDPEEAEMAARARAAMRRLRGVKLNISDERITFDDVAGIGEAKVELVEVVDFFSKPELFRQSGAVIPRGVLLCGPPGTGKTLLARAVAGEAGVSFLSLNASEFVEMFAGVGASRVRDLFDQARSMAPAIIFIDEIDAVGRVRSSEKGNDERDQCLNQMLTEMDGFNTRRHEGAAVIVMAATNRKDILDPALIRPGRFDRIIYVPAPDIAGREEILKVHLGYRPHDAAGINVRDLAYDARGFTGAQLGSLVNTAAGLAGREGCEMITQADLRKALDDELKGPMEVVEMSRERAQRLALQEASIAVVTSLLPALEPVEQVTIVPRAKFPLGQTVPRVSDSREGTRQYTRQYMEAVLQTFLAGRAAEELVHGWEEMSTLNLAQLARARDMAAKLVLAGGMDDAGALRARSLVVPQGPVSDPKLHMLASVSLATQEKADERMSHLLQDSYSATRSLLARNKALLDRLTQALLGNSPDSPGGNGVPSGGNGAPPGGKGAPVWRSDGSVGTVYGSEIQRMVEELGHPADVQRLQQERLSFM